MDSTIQTYVEHLDSLRERIKETIQDLTAEDLNWSPSLTETNSAYILATHIAGSESMWVHEIIGGINVKRDRDSEFQAKGTTTNELVKRIESTAEISRKILSGLTRADLEQSRKEPFRRGGGDISVHGCLLRILEHTSEHLGHLELTKQLLKQR